MSFALSGNSTTRVPELTAGDGCGRAANVGKRFQAGLADHAAPSVRAWVLEHFDAGAVESVDIAINAPLATLQSGGPPVPDDGISIEVVASGATIRPVDGLPPITRCGYRHAYRRQGRDDRAWSRHRRSRNRPQADGHERCV